MKHIVQSALPDAQVLRVVPLKADSSATDETVKAGGYGVPLRVDVLHEGKPRSLVLHTAAANEFGHDRRADRAREMLLAAESFGSIPDHVKVLDVGAYRGNDGLVSLSDTGEFYLLTTYAEGRTYAEDLRRIARTRTLTGLDIERMHRLADYLAELHAVKEDHPASVYVRAIRDTLGSGEGIFGIVDSYPSRVPGASEERLERIEARCLEWRWRIKRRADRVARIHGDFHPFNVLFREKTELALLDASRGTLGDPADDVCAMAINYGFFALGHPEAWRDALRTLWYGFWDLALTRDPELCRVAAPFLAWRGLVLANPKWYPELRVRDRERIFGFIEKALAVEHFSPTLAEEFFDS